jgi:hypothetical protein
VYSARDVVEAYSLCAALKEEGIQARVVGENLGSAAGALPLGEATAPRVWVLQADEARARELIARWTREPHPAPGDLAEEDEEEAWADEATEEGEPPEEADRPLKSDVRFRWLSQGFFIAGTACILFGAIWAWHRWMTMEVYAATAEGQLADLSIGGFKKPFPTGAPGTPVPPQRNPVPRTLLDAQYTYVVDGKTYQADVHNREAFPDRVPIYYDPRDPAHHLVGPLMPPWLALLFASGAGVFLLFVGYQFR